MMDLRARSLDASRRQSRERSFEQIKAQARRKQKLKRRKVLITLFVACICLGAGVKAVSYALEQRPLNTLLRAQNDQQSITSAGGGRINQNFSAASLNSKAVTLVDAKSGETLFEKKSSESIYPASLTKIMAALVAIETIGDLQENVEISSSVFEKIQNENASVAGFSPGERVTAEDLLYGTILASGAESTLALAEHVSGSEKKFVDRMNKKAQELGMRDTHFDNTCGFQSKNHYTTTADMAKLLRYALGNQTFRAVFTSHKHVIRSTNAHKNGMTIQSTLFLALEDPQFKGGAILGGKTGFTDEAGLCLATLAEKSGTEYILVTAGAGGDHHSDPYHIQDAQTIYEDLLL